MSKITQNDVNKALAALKAKVADDVVKGHNSRGTVTTEVPAVTGESGATQVYHTPSNSNPRSWAGSTETDVAENGNTDSVSENGTDYQAQAKLLKSIASKLAKGLPLTKFEKSVLKAMDEEDEDKKVSKAGAACAPGDDKLVKTNKAFPPKKKDEDEDEDEGVNKSLVDFARENDEVSKGFDVSDFLFNFADVVSKSQSASESRIKAEIISALNETAAVDADFQKSLADAVVTLGEALSAVTQRLEQVESAPARGVRSVTGTQAINKGGFNGEGAPLTKSQVADALADMVMKGQASVNDVVSFESNGGVITPELDAKVRRHINGR